MGFLILICTGEKSDSVHKRILKLNIENYLSGIPDKEKSISEWLITRKLDWSNVLYVGDEMNDYNAFKKASFSACPNDSHPEIKKYLQL